MTPPPSRSVSCATLAIPLQTTASPEPASPGRSTPVGQADPRSRSNRTRATAGSSVVLPPPAVLRARLPLSEVATRRIDRARVGLVRRIAEGEGRPVAIVGPCSIHCETAALEYAERLAVLAGRLQDRVQVVMRVYLEKPRTTSGWKGFLYDPDLNGTDDLPAGLVRGRRLMTQIAELGLPIATEILDPMTAAYLSDCLTWVAVGARTSESQIHRQMASHLPCAVGFKNGTDGRVSAAAQACEAASRPHAHLGINAQGHAAYLRSPGNDAAHVVLRGGSAGPNFDRDGVEGAARELLTMGRSPSLLVDCSHGNSQKDYRRQPEVARAVMDQMGQDARGPADLFGLMLESHLVAGRQDLQTSSSGSGLRYGVSVTDGCIDFSTTEGLLFELAERFGKDCAAGDGGGASHGEGRPADRRK